MRHQTRGGALRIGRRRAYVVDAVAGVPMFEPWLGRSVRYVYMGTECVLPWDERGAGYYWFSSLYVRWRASAHRPAPLQDPWRAFQFLKPDSLQLHAMRSTAAAPSLLWKSQDCPTYLRGRAYQLQNPMERFHPSSRRCPLSRIGIDISNALYVLRGLLRGALLSPNPLRSREMLPHPRWGCSLTPLYRRCYGAGKPEYGKTAVRRSYASVPSFDSRVVLEGRGIPILIGAVGAGSCGKYPNDTFPAFKAHKYLMYTFSSLPLPSLGGLPCSAKLPLVAFDTSISSVAVALEAAPASRPRATLYPHALPAFLCALLRLPHGASPSSLPGALRSSSPSSPRPASPSWPLPSSSSASLPSSSSSTYLVASGVLDTTPAPPCTFFPRASLWSISAALMCLDIRCRSVSPTSEVLLDE
ncbi:hypothetical protein K438DRAFT_1975826 [Mycena galopus ATCC 62051]|nr:hypothetical protein K438DRAFT_1975826 [Mycena galopus ATCC 62051]